MKLRNYLAFGGLLVTVALFSFMKPPKVTVSDILRDPAYYDGKKVELTGVIMEYDESPDEIVCYLKGDKDSIIPVTLKSPLRKIYCKLEVTGIVHRDPNNRHVFIEELQGVLKEDVDVNLAAASSLDVDITASLEVE